jgi:hypothetical protein
LPSNFEPSGKIRLGRSGSQALPFNGGTPADAIAYWKDHGISMVQYYQAADRLWTFQTVESGILLALAAILLARIKLGQAVQPLDLVTVGESAPLAFGRRLAWNAGQLLWLGGGELRPPACDQAVVPGPRLIRRCSTITLLP